MIEWLARVDPGAPYLRTSQGVWTYRNTIEEVRLRISDSPLRVTPRPDAESVFSLLAGIAGGGVLVRPAHVDVPDENDLGGAALVVFTSGSTGGPKGVRLTMGNLIAAAEASVAHLGHGADDTWLAAMPLHHVGGLSVLVRSACAGGAVLLHERFDPAGFAIALHADATIASVVPTMLTRLLEADPGPYRELRALLVGGGPLPEGLLERASLAGLPVLPTYGMTETFGQVATLRPGAALGRRAHPLPGMEIRIEDDGRIAVRGPQVSPGYLGETDREEDWLVTGDLGEIDGEGALRVLGRGDALIVTGGENVDPEVVEGNLVEHSGVDEVVVVGLPDSEWGEVLACLYTGSAQPAELSFWLGGRLPGYMVPKRWIAVGEIPRTALGKPDRQAAAAAFDA